ncbi:SUPPRESSOR OF ABI3-5 [Camellia lanceoleosa]|uniref:SUPPRESSOR OF ABI3-5 n=1 Tax=Camellia lanceoleosa TaxID=1840588 RepID=A0ACC0FJC8_9ERIC|nr:SUPPRESSOR OF ABI3-5 [Camellia lanceoleosa]
MSKQRSHEGQAPRVSLDYNQPSASAEDKSNSVGASTRSRYKMEAVITKENITTSSGFTTATSTTAAQSVSLEGEDKPRCPGTLVGAPSSSSAAPAAAYAAGSSSMNADAPKTVTPFRIAASALGSYTPPVTSGSGKGRFSEMPVQSVSTHKEQPQTTAERRSLYGSTSSIGDDVSDLGIGDSRVSKFERYSSSRKDGSGMVEPVKAQAMEKKERRDWGVSKRSWIQTWKCKVETVIELSFRRRPLPGSERSQRIKEMIFKTVNGWLC